MHFIAVAALVAILVTGFGLGFLFLPRHQGDQERISAGEAAHRALGFHTHGATSNTTQPMVRVPTHISWTEETINEARSGDVARGEFIALNCTSCHVEQALTSHPEIPNLAGLDPLVIYKQLDDFRSGTRLSSPMSAIAQSMSPKQYADVAAYFASQAGLPENSGKRALRGNSSYRNGDLVQRLIYAGDPKRGIPACASCHGPGGYVMGAPALSNQNAPYIEQQLQAFAQGTRANDMNMPMRTIASLLTHEEMKSVALAYSKGPESPK
jgi:cytochrome c553